MSRGGRCHQNSHAAGLQPTLLTHTMHGNVEQAGGEGWRPSRKKLQSEQPGKASFPTTCKTPFSSSHLGPVSQETAVTDKVLIKSQGTLELESTLVHWGLCLWFPCILPNK